MEDLYWRTPCITFTCLKGYILYVTSVHRFDEQPTPCCGMPQLLAPSPLHRYATAIISLWWCARPAGSQEGDLYEYQGKFHTTGESLLPAIFSTSLGWLILSAPSGGMPELLAPC
jgi:hypothetical protein